jgi:hypothetical protein
MRAAQFVSDYVWFERASDCLQQNARLITLFADLEIWKPPAGWALIINCRMAAQDLGVQRCCAS